jgi:glycosyltransferase involved in cell wall biosynthesis
MTCLRKPDSAVPEFCPVSVVLPLFNKEEFVCRAIRSVLNQKVVPKEIIVVDDGSTDQGPSRVKELFGSIVTLIRQPNAGVSEARNAGVAFASQPYIAFLDADDEWRPTFLQRITELIEAEPAVNVFATNYWKESVGEPQRKRWMAVESGALQAGQTGRFFEMATKCQSPIHTSAVVVAKHALKAVGGFPPGINSGEDLITWIRLALLGPIAFHPEPCAVYFVRLDDGIKPTVASRRFMSRELSLLLLDPKALNVRGFQEYATKLLSAVSEDLIVLGERREALRNHLLALRYQWKTLAFWYRVALMLCPGTVAKTLSTLVRRRRASYASRFAE